MYLPRLMCTQHPDSTIKITAEEEVEEAVAAYAIYGCDEVMSDFEGKGTPYIQPRDIVLRALKSGIPLGERFFVTPRIPNPSLEDFERSMLAMEAAVLADLRALKEAGVHGVRWIVLPMSESPEDIRLAIDMLARKAAAYSGKAEIQLVPLVEDASRHLRIADFVKVIVQEYIRRGVFLEQVRVFLGKSDSAVVNGHVASALALRVALAEVGRLNSELDHEIAPILGMGSPPFRGGLNNPALAPVEAGQYSGFRTATVQSAVRYDVPYQRYLSVKETLLAAAGRGPDASLDAAWASLVVREASESYRQLVSKYADKIAELASLIPSTRDRVSWRVYGRSVISNGGVVNVPRAIVYTAAWYAAGLPPTLLDAPYITTLHRRGELDKLLKALPAYLRELEYDAQFYDRRRAESLLGRRIVDEVDEALDVLGIRAERAEGLPPFVPSQSYVLAEARARGFLG
ncbi:MAG: phosphoenolpyruvate carboxylase [Thermoproteus sp.]|jgi:phosphoenolpyruvate carboxylase